MFIFISSSLTRQEIVHICIYIFLRLPIPVDEPYLSNRLAWTMKMLFPRGFSANFVLFTWSLFGGVLLHGFLANFRVMLLMPVMEKQVNTAQDILDRGLIPFTRDDEYWIDHMKNSPNPVYQQLAEIAVVPKDYAELLRMLKEDLQGAGTPVYLYNILFPEEEELGDYHWSKEILQGDLPFIFWLVSNRWPLKDDLAKHILIWQQVRRIIFN